MSRSSTELESSGSLGGGVASDTLLEAMKRSLEGVGKEVKKEDASRVNQMEASCTEHQTGTPTIPRVIQAYRLAQLTAWALKVKL